MVMQYSAANISAVPPPLRPITQQKFDKGVISIVGPANLPLNALARAKNLILDEDGRPTIRAGNDWYGADVPASRSEVSVTLTNLVMNPSFEDGSTSGYGNHSSPPSINTVAVGSLSPVAYSGSNYMQCHTDVGKSGFHTHYVCTGLTVGVTYEAFVHVYPTNSTQTSISLGEETGNTSTSITPVLSQWNEIHHTFVAGATTVNISVFSAVGGATRNVFVDALAVGVGITGSFDGNSANTAAVDYAWTGTTNASTSTQTTFTLQTREIEGGGFYVTSDEAVHLLAISGGYVYRSLDNGQTWDQCTGGRFTSGKEVQMQQISGLEFMYDSYDYILRYNGSLSLLVYNELLTPVAPAATKTGLAGTTLNTLTYVMSAVNDVGYTAASTIAYDSTTNVITVDRDRGSFDDTNFVQLQWNNGVVDANHDGLINDDDFTILSADYHTGIFKYPVRYDLYVSVNGATAQYFDSVDVSGLDELAQITYLDKGQLPTNSVVLAPTDNTTLGPRVGDMVQVDTRVYATEDFDFPWRVWISGEGIDIAKFSSAFGATYIDLQNGSQFRPVKVVPYQDGKGNPLATVWCDSVDGLGCVWQGTIDTFTVGDVSFPVPNFSKLPGSRGTNAPRSVVNVLNDYYYYNSQAFYNLGTRLNFSGLLSTDEASANIRPDVRSIRTSASGNTASYFFERTIYMSVPWNSDINNRIICYDTERKAWLPEAFDFGVSGFFQYADTTGEIHLLCWKPGDIRFTEISSKIQSNYGDPIESDLLTGLVHANPANRMDFMWVEEAEFELSKVSGTIDIELAGVTREDGFVTIDSKRIEPSTTPIGWTKNAWTKHAWSAGSRTAITNYSEPTTKRYFNIQQDVNCYQWHITTGTTLGTNYLCRTLQVSGTDTDGGKPREWEML